mgnify:CR=1 FL=1
MDTNAIIYAMVSIGGLGIVFGAILGFASKIFAVDEDPRIGQVLECLPGANCGGCGYPGCGGLATAIVEGRAPVNACAVGGASAAAAIAEVMGVVAEEKEPTVAFVKCGGTCEKTKSEYEYYGIKDCIMASQMQDGGAKGCAYGCLGYGSCVDACPFDAIHIVDGIAVVDKEACKACGKCVDACPKHLIELIPYKQKTFVQCNSNEKGKALMDVCQVGCIGCRLCERNCEAGAITVNNFLAHIDADKCTNCGVCAEKCPRKIITVRFEA